MLVLVLALAACAATSRQPAGRTRRPRRPRSRASSKSWKRDAIVAAANSLDYDRFETLLDPKFSYSFVSGDPVGYWRRLEKEGHMPILGDYLPLVFSAPYARKQDTFIWPSAYAKKPANGRGGPPVAQGNLYTEEEIRQFERFGGYLGYRVGSAPTARGSSSSRAIDARQTIAANLTMPTPSR